MNIVQGIQMNHCNIKIIHVTRLRWYITAIIVHQVNDLICGDNYASCLVVLIPRIFNQDLVNKYFNN